MKLSQKKRDHAIQMLTGHFLAYLKSSNGYLAGKDYAKGHDAGFYLGFEWGLQEILGKAETDIIEDAAKRLAYSLYEDFKKHNQPLQQA